MTERGRFDVAIVGGGPAGMAAANRLGGHGLSVAVIDEQQQPGGQILRQPPASFRVRDWLDGSAYRAPRAALAAFPASGAIWLGGRSVIGLTPVAEGFRLQTAGPQGYDAIEAGRVVLATGCYDLPMARPGWTLPGVMSAGGVQTLLKSQQLVPDAPLALAGTHPLMLLVAEQVIAAGGTVACVAFEQPLAAMIGPAIHAPAAALASAPLLLGALAGLIRLRRRGVAIRFGQALAAIEGEDRARGVLLRAPDGREERIACASVGLCYGFVPQSDLTRLAGASVVHAAPAGGWAARHDDGMRTDVPGLLVAGEAAGVGGAACALTEGRLAALSILVDAGLAPVASVRREAVSLRRRRIRQRGFAAMLAAMGDPSPAFAQPLPPEALLCRCENVSMGIVAAAVAEGLPANAVKLGTRIGMGLCQGRSCEHALLRLIAARDGADPADVPGFAARFPVRPARIGDIAGVASDATISGDHGD
ncbi:MAG: FAD-dependent oxidoreductase [Sphingomonas bacterium]